MLNYMVRARLTTISSWGSREILANEQELIWYPAEVNTSIRLGWFWHESENDKVRSLEELVNIYYNSVGGNATFLLNIPPTNEGLLHENDVKRLAEIGEYLEKAFGENLLEKARLSADGVGIESVRADSYDDYFTAEKGRNTAEITAEWEQPVSVGNIVLKENIRMGQRVESFTVEVRNNGVFSEFYSGTVIGYKRIVPLKNITADAVRIRITDSRAEPVISFMRVYEGDNT